MNAAKVEEALDKLDKIRVFCSPTVDVRILVDEIHRLLATMDLDELTELEEEYSDVETKLRHTEWRMTELGDALLTGTERGAKLTRYMVDQLLDEHGVGT